MTALRRWLAVAVGLTATAVGLYLAVRRFEPATPGTEPGTAVWLVGLAAVAAAAWLVFDRSRTAADGSVPWSDAGPIVDGTPEAAPLTDPLSGGDLAARLRDAGATARERRRIEPGVAVVRPTLRETYLDAMAAAGQDRTAARDALDRGAWTDDRVAAAVLSTAVDPPARSIRQRLVDWLYPGRAVTRRTVRAVSAVGAAADEALPPVVGSDAPRQFPTHDPSLAVQHVGADDAVRAPAGDRSRPVRVAEDDGGDRTGESEEGRS